MRKWLGEKFRRKLARRPSLFLVVAIKSGRFRLFLPFPLFVITDFVNSVVTLAAFGLWFVPRSARTFYWTWGRFGITSRTVWGLRHAWEALINRGSWTLVDIEDERGNMVKIRLY